MIYEYVKAEDARGIDVVKNTDDKGQIWVIPTDPANSDYQRYLAYVANGNKEPDSTLPSNSSTPQAGA